MRIAMTVNFRVQVCTERNLCILVFTQFFANILKKDYMRGLIPNPTGHSLTINQPNLKYAWQKIFKNTWQHIMWYNRPGPRLLYWQKLIFFWQFFWLSEYFDRYILGSWLVNRRYYTIAYGKFDENA